MKRTENAHTSMRSNMQRAPRIKSEPIAARKWKIQNGEKENNPNNIGDNGIG